MVKSHPKSFPKQQAAQDEDHHQAALIEEEIANKIQIASGSERFDYLKKAQEKLNENLKATTRNKKIPNKIVSNLIKQFK